jgi:hypothetical protein
MPGGRDRANEVELDVTRFATIEEPDSVTEHGGNQVDRDLVEQPGPEALPHHPRDAGRGRRRRPC